MISLGSLCSGYGGLELGVQSVLGGHTAWVSDVDPGACRILAHRFPGVPNIGDMTTVDWTQVEPVDVLTGGTPCQDLSHAGKRAGMSAGTRSNLWVAMREAIAALRPSLIVWENVQGAYSAEADSELGSNPRLLDGTRRRAGEPVLRALGRVLGDLDSLGYVGGWHGIRAADVGAPHGRLRVFVVAYPGGARQSWTRGRGIQHGWESDQCGYGRAPAAPELGRAGAGGSPGPHVGALLPTPTGDDANNDTRDSGDFQSLARTAARLLPTPQAHDAKQGSGESAEQRNRLGRFPNPALADVPHLLPTPIAAEGTKPSNSMGVDRRAATGEVFLTNVIVSQWGDDPTELVKRDGYGTWGDYGPAVARWETLTRPAPEPTEPSSKGRPRLSPRFAEWLMGLPDGWVTDVPGVTRAQALRAIGNGVVPQQAAAAVRILLDVIP